MDCRVGVGTALRPSADRAPKLFVCVCVRRGVKVYMCVCVCAYVHSCMCVFVAFLCVCMRVYACVHERSGAKRCEVVRKEFVGMLFNLAWL